MQHLIFHHLLIFRRAFDVINKHEYVSYLKQTISQGKNCSIGKIKGRKTININITLQQVCRGGTRLFIFTTSLVFIHRRIFHGGHRKSSQFNETTNLLLLILLKKRTFSMQRIPEDRRTNVFVFERLHRNVCGYERVRTRGPLVFESVLSAGEKVYVCSSFTCKKIKTQTAIL